MRVRVTSGDIRPLTRVMTALGRDAQPILRDVGTSVSRIAAKDIAHAADRFSGQSRGLSGSIEAKRDRVPYVVANGGRIFRRNGTSRKNAVRIKHIARAVEYGVRPGNPRYKRITRRHGTVPQRWSPLGYWWNPTLDKRRDAYHGMYVSALSDLLDRTWGRL